MKTELESTESKQDVIVVLPGSPSKSALHLLQLVERARGRGMLSVYIEPDQGMRGLLEKLAMVDDAPFAEHTLRSRHAQEAAIGIVKKDQPPFYRQFAKHGF